MEILASVLLVGLGLVLAFAGRRFIWLLVGAAGFLVGYWLADLLLPGNNLATVLLSVLAGVAAAFFIRGATMLILAIIGFLFVGSAAMAFGGLFGITPFSLPGLITFVVGGVLGIVLVNFVGGVGLMIVTALAGASLVKMGLPDLGLAIGSSVVNLIGIGVAIVGFVVQYASRNR